MNTEVEIIAIAVTVTSLRVARREKVVSRRHRVTDHPDICRYRETFVPAEGGHDFYEILFLLSFDLFL